MNIRRHLTILLLLLLSLLLTVLWIGKEGFIPVFSLYATQMVAPSARPQRTGTADNTFITRSGSSLLLNGKPFRFSGVNIYWLGLEETENGVAYPSRFRVDDALATASFMGATVVRAHSLGISTGCALCLKPTADTFNPTAFQYIDYAIQEAKAHHLRLIIPLTDNWRFYLGGKHTFTEWRGLANENAFYSNRAVINDFKAYVSTLLNHVNTYTGIAYKDDPTILAWETGNELVAPFDWVREMATYIKGVDSHHLLMDGNAADAQYATTFSLNLKIPAVDLYTGHYYPPTISSFRAAVYQAQRASKVFIVGEYDWNTTDGNDLSSFLSAVLNSGASGDMYWSIFPHDDQYGFVPQNEHFTLHYPGDTPDMRQRVAMLRAHAFAMQGRPVPTTMQPGTPLITSVQNNKITWRGAYGADTYSIERSTTGTRGPWTVICDRCATDLTTPWQDATPSPGNAIYRVRGFSLYGVPGPYSASASKGSP